jgi:uncharacterized protein (DUF305 family)
MKNNTFIIGTVTLIVGVLLGYAIWGNAIVNAPVVTKNESLHQVTDGSMMSGSGQMNMNDMMAGMMNGINSKTGDEFDKAFLSEMIVHHQGAVTMANAVLKTSKRPELLKLANEIISAQTKEIEMMKGWQKNC